MLGASFTSSVSTRRSSLWSFVGTQVEILLIFQDLTPGFRPASVGEADCPVHESVVVAMRVGVMTASEMTSQVASVVAWKSIP